jgi:branched-chain amino acid transport system substrate-binding protein
MNQGKTQIWMRRLAGAAVVAAAGFGLTCASAPGPATDSTAAPAPAPAAPSSRAREREAARLYSEAEAAFEAANFVAAESLTSGLVDDYVDTRWHAPGLLLSAQASFELNQMEDARATARRYLRLFRASDPERSPGLVLVARALYVEGRTLEAADSLLATPIDLGDSRESAAQTARQVVSELGLGEIEAVTARWPAGHPLQSVFGVERASLLLVAGHADSARDVAASVLAFDPMDPERDRARSIESGEIESDQWRPIIGAILPLSGTLARFGQLAEEGIRLAIDEYNQRHYDQVTLIVRDDGDDLDRAGDLVRELEQLGVVAIIGPLRAEGLEEAARRRRDRDLVIVSPTAADNYSFARNTYSVFSTTEIVTRGARALGAFAVRDLQVDRFGVMYPNNREGREQLAAFADAVRARGAEIVASIAYDDTSTTFQEPLTFLGAANPQAIYAPASNAQGVIQMAPQFSYYGLRGTQVLGDADWSDPLVLRLVEPRFINGTVISTFLYRSSPALRWPEFVEMYERKYRKGLRGSMVPALSYDATQLILESLPWGFPRRSAIARSFRNIRSMPGATGVFSVEDGAITRRPFLLQFKDSELVPAYDELRRDRASMEGNGG